MFNEEYCKHFVEWKKKICHVLQFAILYQSISQNKDKGVWLDVFHHVLQKTNQTLWHLKSMRKS